MILKNNCRFYCFEFQWHSGQNILRKLVTKHQQKETPLAKRMYIDNWGSIHTLWTKIVNWNNTYKQEYFQTMLLILLTKTVFSVDPNNWCHVVIGSAWLVPERSAYICLHYYMNYEIILFYRRSGGNFVKHNAITYLYINICVDNVQSVSISITRSAWDHGQRSPARETCTPCNTTIHHTYS